jgi:hypothetical protein
VKYQNSEGSNTGTTRSVQFALNPGLLGHGFLELGALVVIGVVFSGVLLVVVVIC